MIGLDSSIKPPWETERWLLWILLFFAVFTLVGPEAFAQARIPGTDASDKLEAAGTLLRIVDTSLFKWGARIFSGIAILSAGWALKEQKFGTAVIAVVAAIVIGTAPMWVANIFDIGGGQGIFSMNVPTETATYA